MKLSLDTAAKFSEVVGAVAVVIGLIFVGLEIRGNTVAQQFSATQTLVSEYNAAIKSINDGEFICIYIAAGIDFDKLSQSDKIRYSVLMQPILRTFEQLHYSALQGTIDANVHSGFERQYAALMQVKGMQQYWAARSQWFGDAFQDYTEHTIANSDGVAAANFETEECG
jgi:hypothetical protein